MFFENSEGMKIFYRDSIIEEENVDKSTLENTIIFMHAWGSSSKDFDYSFENLKGIRKIVYDHRGFGQSDKPNKNMSLNRLAKDLKELIDYLKLKNVIILGYSMGACVLYKYIELYGTDNIKALVVVDMTPRILNDDEWKLGFQNGDFKEKDLLESLAVHFDDLEQAYVNLYTELNPKLKNRNTSFLRRMIRKELEPNSCYSITSMWFSIAYADFREVIKDIDVETGLFFAHPGSLVNPDSMKYLEENIEKTYPVLFENSTHSFVNNKPKQFCSELQKFIDKIIKKSS